MRLGSAFLAFLLCSSFATAEPLTIAVASNFRAAAEEIVVAYNDATGFDARISSASTSKLYAQIRNGAPFDVFLAADSKHPRLLEDASLTTVGSRTTYALGSLVLWSPEETDCRQALDSLGKRYLAIANPQTAPYGIAAKQFLVSAGLWERVEQRLVYGENVGQAMQFVATRNAQLGLIAASQAADPNSPPSSCAWAVPAGTHEPIEQQLVVLRRTEMNQAVSAFVEFLASDAAKSIIYKYGYRNPE
jgi:molybdate transport system substrate-binding protein